jgi:hypothetical protein
MGLWLRPTLERFISLKTLADMLRDFSFCRDNATTLDTPTQTQHHQLNIIPVITVSFQRSSLDHFTI